MTTPTHKPWQPALLSFALPGLGQLSNGQTERASIIFTTLIVLNIFVAWLLTIAPESLRIFVFADLVLGNLLIYAYAITQAYIATPNDKRIPWYHLLILWLIGTSIVLGTVMLERKYLIHAFVIPSSSMQPSINEGDYLMTTMRKSQVFPVANGDVVVFLNPNNPSIYYIKRILAMPNDMVKSDGTTLFVNGKNQGEYTGKAFKQIVPQGHVFMIGDHRMHTSSSMDFGMVPIQNIVAKPILRFASSQSKIGTTSF